MKKPPGSAWPLALLAVAAGCSDAAPSNQDAAVDVIAADVGSTDVVSTDVGTTDVGTTDAGSVVFHGCTAFVDRTADGAERTVRFTNYRYDPACMLVAAGQRVTFSGDFAVHQFRPGVAPSRAASDPPAPANNPMTARDDGTSATFDFPAAGTYPFFCLDHEGTGMYGAIRVR
jgi:plastocyanin